MIDLIVIGAIIHFCILGHKIVRAYEHDVYENEDYIQIINDDDGNDNNPYDHYYNS